MAKFGHAKQELSRRFMKLECGIPSSNAFSDLFGTLDPDGLRGNPLKLAST